MSVDTQAMIVWGIYLKEFHQDEELQWDDIYARSFGLEAPKSSFTTETSAEWKLYFTARVKLVHASGCNLQLHGDERRYLWLAVVNDSLIKTALDLPPTPFVLPEVPAEWQAKLQGFCQRIGLPDGPFGWILTAVQH